MEEIKMEKVGPLKEGEFWVITVPETKANENFVKNVSRQVQNIRELVGKRVLVTANGIKLTAQNREMLLEFVGMPDYSKSLIKIKAAIDELQDKNPLGESNQAGDIRFISKKNIKSIAATMTHILDQCKKVGFE